MSEVIKVRWLTDNEGNKVAPKTLSSQVMNEDGTLFKDTIQANLDALSELVGDTPVSDQINDVLDSMEAISFSEIDEICGATVYAASEVLL